jgi:hypothetical protein
MLLCNTSGKYYIGSPAGANRWDGSPSSINLQNRLKQYCNPIVRQNYNFIIYRAINKYGLDNFSPGGRSP